jgi:hypothetical protein
MAIVASHKGCSFELCYDAEIIGLAERAAAAFPHIPLLGVDLVREEPSGKGYVLEVNPGGQVWSFSTPTGRGIQERGDFHLESQFDGLRKMAAILVEQARRHAA